MLIVVYLCDLKHVNINISVRKSWWAFKTWYLRCFQNFTWCSFNHVYL